MALHPSQELRHALLTREYPRYFPSVPPEISLPDRQIPEERPLEATWVGRYVHEFVELLDEYVRMRRVKSGSAAVQQAVELLRAVDLAADYADAWAEWEAAADKTAWERATHDGLTT